MEIDNKLDALPRTKSNSKTLHSLFGNSKMTPMWVADMDFQIAAPIQKALIQRVQNSGFGYEYKPESFFAAQKNWYNSMNEIDLDQNQILFSPSITTTISILIENFTSRGDGIIIQPPVFMEFKDVIRKTKRKLIKNNLKLVDQKYEIDLEDLNNKAAESSNKMLILCNPHNPVGRVWSEHELHQIVSICKSHDVLLISDEIHKDVILFGNKFNSVLNQVDVWRKIVVCTSEAKTFNLCGISDSIAIIPNEEIRLSIKKTMAKYNLGRTNALTRVALETAYKFGEDWLRDLISSIECNVNSIRSELVDSEVNLIEPEGTFQVWLDFRNVFADSQEMFKAITQKSNVAINAGHWFGRAGARFMRMNIATSNEVVIDCMSRIKEAILDMHRD